MSIYRIKGRFFGKMGNALASYIHNGMIHNRKVENDDTEKEVIIRTSLYLTVQFSSVPQSCPTLCDPMNCSMPGLPVHHKLLE